MDFEKSNSGHDVQEYDVYGHDSQENEEEQPPPHGKPSCCCKMLTPLALVLGIVLLGWNEKRAICEANALYSGMDVTQEVGCDQSEAEGDLVLFTCDVSKDGLPDWVSTGDFASANFGKGACFNTASEMYQCKDLEQHDDKGRPVYDLQWSGQEEDLNLAQSGSSRGIYKGCGKDATNPPWSSRVARNGVQYADEVKVGAYRIKDTKILSGISCNTSVSTEVTPSGWHFAGGMYKTSTSAEPTIGDLRVQFYTNNWDKPEVTVLGMNEGGTVSGWTAPDSWLCSGYQLGSLKEGKYTKDEMYEALLAESDDTTLLFRFVGFLLLWFAFCNAMHDFAAPIFMIADFVPMVGPYIGESLGKVICAVSCFPATGCAIMIIGICWVAFRPTVGIPLVLLSCFAGAYFAYWKKQKQDEKAAQAAKTQDPSPEDAKAPAAQVEGNPV